MTKEEVKKLPTLQEVVEQILTEEAQIVKHDSPPIAIIEPSPSAIHKPFVEYFNDYDDKNLLPFVFHPVILNGQKNLRLNPI